MRYPRGVFSNIDFVIDTPWPPHAVSAEGLQVKVAALRGDWKRNISIDGSFVSKIPEEWLVAMGLPFFDSCFRPEK